MKKLSTIIGICLLLSSCDRQSNIQKQKDIPIEVAKMANAHNYDTLIVVKTEKGYYEYKDDVYISTIQEKNDELSMLLLGIFLGMLGLLFLFALFSITSD